MDNYTPPIETKNYRKPQKPKPEKPPRKPLTRAQKKAIKISALVFASLVVIVGGFFGITTAINNSKIEKVESLIADLPDDENYYLDYKYNLLPLYH